ncbi:MAG: hypothetical protein QNJ72_12775 [Pleurocapsa sp. MO_226.B13]|nr:hypothetical protein [Pleurocapsa sp. MO_226.B13]
MNVNRTHRLNIVDRQYKVRQIVSAKSLKIKKAAGQDNVIQIVSQEQREAA